jgi:biotin-(acetyl-CoA carboxylase) ligase
LLAGESATDLDEWMARAIFLNEPIQIVDAGRTISGTFIGVDPGGALLLRDANGEIINVVAGDLTRGPQPVN